MRRKMIHFESEKFWDVKVGFSKEEIEVSMEGSRTFYKLIGFFHKTVIFKTLFNKE
jgi:hypothetical protein